MKRRAGVPKHSSRARSTSLLSTVCMKPTRDTVIVFILLFPNGIPDRCSPDRLSCSRALNPYPANENRSVQRRGGFCRAEHTHRLGIPAVRQSMWHAGSPGQTLGTIGHATRVVPAFSKAALHCDRRALGDQFKLRPWQPCLTNTAAGSAMRIRRAGCVYEFACFRRRRVTGSGHRL